VVHDRNLRFDQLIHERSQIEHERSINPSSEVQERWFRKEHEINLIIYEWNVLKHAADIRTDQLNKALFRKSETETHIVNVKNHLARVNEAEVQRQATEAAKQQETQKLNQSLIGARSLNQENIQTHASLPSLNQAMAMTATAGLANTAPAAESLLARITTAMAELGRIASSSKAGPQVAIIAAGLYPTKVGVGSDKVPGGKHFAKALPAAMLNMPTEEHLRFAAQENNAIEVPIRGRLVLTSDQINIELVRTEQPTPVRVVAGVPDGNGNYQCTRASYRPEPF